MGKRFFTDNHDQPQMAHLIAFIGVVAGAVIIGFGLWFVMIGNQDGIQTLFIGAGLMAGGGALEGYERRIEGPGK